MPILGAEETALRIKRLRRSLNWHENHEFILSKASKQVRLQFLNETKGCDFRIRAITADKARIRSQELKGNKNSFYTFMIKEVLAKCGTSIRGAKVRLDGHEDRVYKKPAKTYFRQLVSLITDFKFVDSKTDNLIQLADMVAGSILRSRQTDKTDSEAYTQIIASRIEDIWDFQ